RRGGGGRNEVREDIEGVGGKYEEGTEPRGGHGQRWGEGVAIAKDETTEGAPTKQVTSRELPRVVVPRAVNIRWHRSPQEKEQELEADGIGSVRGDRIGEDASDQEENEAGQTEPHTRNMEHISGRVRHEVGKVGQDVSRLSRGGVNARQLRSPSAVWPSDTAPTAIAEAEPPTRGVRNGGMGEVDLVTKRSCRGQRRGREGGGLGPTSRGADASYLNARSPVGQSCQGRCEAKREELSQDHASMGAKTRYHTNKDQGDRERAIAPYVGESRPHDECATSRRREEEESSMAAVVLEAEGREEENDPVSDLIAPTRTSQSCCSGPVLLPSMFEEWDIASKIANHKPFSSWCRSWRGSHGSSLNPAPNDLSQNMQSERNHEVDTRGSETLPPPPGISNPGLPVSPPKGPVRPRHMSRSPSRRNQRG
ncbi:unnamed protein product, partial [Discosporangium mesarthrocarpum]